MNEEIKALREEVAKLRERIAVLEARQMVTNVGAPTYYSPPQFSPTSVPYSPPRWEVTCSTGMTGACGGSNG